MGYADANNLDGLTSTPIEPSDEVIVVSVTPNSEGMSEDEKQELANDLLRAQASRARVQAQLDEEEIRLKLNMADAVISILDYRWLLGAVFVAFLGFVFWLGLTVGRSG